MSRFGTPSFIEHVVRHFWFLQFLGWGNKKTPAPAVLLGQEITSCGATRLGALFAPTSRALPCTGIWSRSAAPSHILQGVKHAPCFRSPSKVHSAGSSSAAISPSAALWENGALAYSLFLNGFSAFYHAFFLLSMGNAQKFFSPPNAFTIDSPLQKTDVV